MASSTTTSYSQLEAILQKRLNIKYVAAKKLIQDAIQNCELDALGRANQIPMHRQDEIIEEACEIYNDLTIDEQNSMCVASADAVPDGSNKDEPEWKRKAREKAERREAEWQVQQNLQQNTDHVHAVLREHGVPEHEVQNTKIKSIRKVGQPPESSVQTKQENNDSIPIVRVTSHTCYCVIQ